MPGWLCGPRHPVDGTVEFALAGASYDHTYWTGLGSTDYSYVAAAARDGHPTLIIDRLGTGAADHPDPNLLTFQAEAWTVHQLVLDLRAGRIGGLRWRHVIGVGHSMGAGLWLVEAGTYTKDVDGLILADFLHATNAEFIPKLQADYEQANTEAQWADLPAGYLTVRPRSVFYNTAEASPSMIARDERSATTFPVGLATSLASTRLPALSQAITAPILLATGSADPLGCNPTIGLSCANATTIINRERANFSSKTRLTGFVLAAAGHDINLHYGAQRFFAAANHWIDHDIH